ncbi:MAG: helix-turn-helix domain-containing protein [Actinomycetota bacterium]
MPPPGERRFRVHDEAPGRPRRGAWRDRGRRPSRGPDGEVRWWERPAPGGDEALWAAVVRCHEALRAAELTVTDLEARLAGSGHSLRRETLSRILNGRQRTTWTTVEVLAEVLDVDLDEGGPGR